MASTAWERRNERARAAGYRNYYEQRTRKAPGAAKPSREELRRRRGHAGPGDLSKLLKAGKVELVNVVQTGYDPPTFDVLCIMEDGSQRSFTLRGEKAARRFRADVNAAGPDAPQIIGSPKGRARLQEDAELEAELAAAEADAEDFGEGGDKPAAFDDSDIPF